MHASTVHHSRIAPSASTASAVAALLVYESDCDMPRVSIPRPEIHLVVRFGPSTRSGLDVHAFGVRQRVHRKLIRRGQRIVMARLHLGAPEAVLGVRASAIAGRIVALEPSSRASIARYAPRARTVRRAGRASPLPPATTTKRISSPSSARSRA